jgi:hypothetical protein
MRKKEDQNDTEKKGSGMEEQEQNPREDRLYHSKDPGEREIPNPLAVP